MGNNEVPEFTRIAVAKALCKWRNGKRSLINFYDLPMDEQIAYLEQADDAIAAYEERIAKNPTVAQDSGGARMEQPVEWAQSAAEVYEMLRARYVGGIDTYPDNEIAYVEIMKESAGETIRRLQQWADTMQRERDYWQNVADCAYAETKREIVDVKPGTLPINIDEALEALHTQYQFCGDAIIARRSPDAPTDIQLGRIRGAHLNIIPILKALKAALTMTTSIEDQGVK